MSYIHLVVLFVAGFSCLNLISTRFSWLEKLAFSFPLAYGFVTLMMFVYGMLGIKLTLGALYVPQLLMIAASAVVVYLRNDRKLSIDLKAFEPLRGFSFFSINLPWIFTTIVLGYVVYVCLAKALFWPTIAFDSIAGYDFVAKQMAAEGTIKTSMFSEDNPYFSIRSGYPLFVPGSFAYTYMMGFATSKMATAVFILSIVLSFYALLRKYVNHTAAAIFTLLFVSTPEYIAMSALSLTNVPQSLLVISGVIPLFIWMDKQDKKYFYLALIMLALNVWARSDGINFLAGCGVAMLLYAWKHKKWLELGLFSAITIIPFITWQIYLVEVFQIQNSGVFIKTLFWDGEKLDRLMTLMWGVMKSTQYYGIAPYLIVIGILANALYITKKNYMLLISIMASLMIYIWMYYQMDNLGEDFRFSLKAMITSSYKRGMFSFIALFYFYVAISPMSQRLFRFAMEPKSSVTKTT